MLPERVVLDTNVIISYAVSHRLSELVAIKSVYGIEIFSSEELIVELSDALEYPQVAKFISEDERRNVVRLFKALAVEIKLDLRYDRFADVRDNFLGDLAFACKANFIISGDKEVLIQKHIGRIQIISPAQFRKILKENK